MVVEKKQVVGVKDLLVDIFKVFDDILNLWVFDFFSDEVVLVGDGKDVVFEFKFDEVEELGEVVGEDIKSMSSDLCW